MWDYCIVGGGPTGLALAWYLSQYKKKVIIIERESTIGGCHRVRRINGFFTEHGPRVYGDNYHTLQYLLDDMGLDFHNFFTKYHADATKMIASQIQWKEIFWLSVEFIRMTFYESYSRNISMKEFMRGKGFTQKTVDILDRLCRLVDGAGMDRYTLFEFLQLLNQSVFYNILQLKEPTDLLLFPKWKEALSGTGLVDIILNKEVVKLVSTYDKVSQAILNSGEKIEADNFILAIPPKHIIKLMSSSVSVENAFGPLNQLKKWEKKVRYISYIPIVFHWDVDIDLSEEWVALPISSWGLIRLILTNHMKFQHPGSKTVISTSVSILDKPSDHTGKTANESTRKELVEEVYRVLKLSLPQLPPPTKAIISPGIYREGDKWVTKDSAFVLTKGGFLQQNSDMFPNLYNVGPHNGLNKYYITTIESAVSNAVGLLHKLIPSSKNRYRIEKPFSIIDIIYILLMVIILYSFSN